MEIKKTEESGKLVVSVIGRLDTTTAPTLESDLAEDLKNFDAIDLDFVDLDYISSAGLRALLMMQKTMSAKSGKLVIKHVKEEIMEVFDMTGFSSFLVIED